ncbi:hypothetical protein FHU29_002564 [Hoyosella altamirensis]|uniref:Uncharacterized protein n=1 Tax=Hoyosella altamirensis TaxID=616997 RepID=A0A839RMZ9_9ACTN|nr:hypothetical protein [Hoyosella altamirensis]
MTITDDNRGCHRWVTVADEADGRNSGAQAYA